MFEIYNYQILQCITTQA